MPRTLSGERSFHRVARVRLRHRRITIGRAVGNTLTLPDPRISRRHCEIHLDGSDARINDRGSTHGIRINGRNVREALLENGDRIELGSFRLTFIGRSIDTPVAGETVLDCPCLEIECRISGPADGGEPGAPDDYDHVLGEALKQIEFLKQRLLDRNAAVGGDESLPEPAEARGAGSSGGSRRARVNGEAASGDPPLPVEMLFQLDAEMPRSVVDVDLGKWFVGALLLLLAVALLWLFV
jgi:hypothetical protein